MATRIILTRHGETVWNLERKVQGILDSSLTERGVLQARNLGKRLSGEKIKCIYTSDLPRAVATAHEIQACFDYEIPLFLEPSLRELSFGEWEGKKWTDLRTLYPQIFQVWDTKPHTVNIPGGENMKSVTKRAWDFLSKILNQHDNETICLVTHGLTLKLLVTKALGYDIHEWDKTPWQSNTALNIIEYDGKTLNPIILGDCSHLE